MAAQPPCVLEILAPDLLDVLERSWTPDDPAAGRLAGTLARAACVSVEWPGYESALLACCGIDWRGPGSPPLAQVTAAHDLGAVPAGVVRADPVHLRADPARVVLFDADSIALTGAEADALIALLNETLAAGALELRRGAAPTRWYLAGPDTPATPAATPAASPASLRGQPLEPNAGMRAGLARFGSLLTEIQMVLHECDVNRAREAAGKPPINSVWLWGSGELPDPAPAPGRVLVGDDALLAALAAHCRVPHHRDLSAALQRRVAGPIAALAAPGSAVSAPDRFVPALLEPALSALAHRRVSEVRIRTPQGLFVLTRRARWRVWRSAAAFMAERRAARGEA